MKRTTLLTAAIAAALGTTPALAGDAETLRAMKAQMAEMQRQIEAMEARLEEQETKQDKVATQVAQQEKKYPGLGKAVQVYGQARVSADFTDNDVGSDGEEIVSNASRIGVQGEMDTTIAGTAVFYRAELRYETTDEVNGDDTNFADIDGDGDLDPVGEDGGDSKELEFREGFAGLKGGWGKLRVGRLSTEYKKTGTTIDPWTDNAPQGRGGGRQGMSEMHSSYFNNAIDYVTPKFAGGFTANAWYSTRFDNSSKNLHNAGALTNFKGGDAGGIGVKYASGPLFVGVDWVDIDADSIAGGGVSNDSAWQIGARYKVMDNLSFAALYEDSEDLGLGENWYVNGIYRVGNTRLIAAYGQSNDRVANGNNDWDNWSIGAKYDLTKKSELLVAWNRRQDDTNDNDFDTLTVGINAKFGY
ncbi:MAG: porin [Gammaproteobacteria bacterium]|nr:porin [Gammaproteobacteria bacterium]